MEAILRAISVDYGRLDQIFPLVQARRPDLSFEQLKQAHNEYAEQKSDRGLMGFENNNGYLLGFCTYCVVQDILDGQILFVNHFIPMDVMGRYNTMETMVRAIEFRARAIGCRSIQVNLHDPVALFPKQASPTIENLKSLGHRFDGLTLYKAISAEPLPSPV